MAKSNSELQSFDEEQIYWGADVPMKAIRTFARAVAKRFHPDKIVLFGSHAYGTPNRDSDVDILVVMPARNKHSQAVKIRWEISAPFPMDLLIRTSREVARGLAEGDTFLTEIFSKGKVLYEGCDARMDKKSRSRLPRRNRIAWRSRCDA